MAVTKRCPSNINKVGALTVSSLTIGTTAVEAGDIAITDLTATAAEINAVVDGCTATAAELNIAADSSSFVGTYTVTTPAAIPATVRVIELNHATDVIAKTIADLSVYAGKFVIVKDISATGTAAHTVTITTGTWNGTNKVVTLNANNECIVVFVDSAGNGTVVLNLGSVGVSG
jgi:hypothetical protein